MVDHDDGFNNNTVLRNKMRKMMDVYIHLLCLLSLFIALSFVGWHIFTHFINRLSLSNQLPIILHDNEIAHNNHSISEYQKFDKYNHTSLDLAPTGDKSSNNYNVSDMFYNVSEVSSAVHEDLKD